jgi:outer membrane protein
MAIFPAVARAEDLEFFLRAGPATMFPNEGAKVKAGGALVNGGTMSIDSHTAGAVEIAYAFTPHLEVTFTGGYPPTIDVSGELARITVR